jgi:hypothetical protein
MYNHQFSIPDWSRIQNPYHYVDRSSRELVITVGDSWTYGDSLGTTKVRNGVDDTDYRLNHVYGNVLTEQLGTDWMNLALPGASNYCMLNWLGQLLDRKFNYSQTTCLITLTEAGRHEELRWAEGDLLQPALENIVTKTYSMVKELRLRFPRVVFKIAHNFTDSVDGFGVIEKTWLEVLTNQALQDNTFIVISDHIKQLNYNRTYPDTPAVIDRALKRIDILDACAYCNKEDSRHPTEYGHKLWAEYLATQL